MLQNSSAEHQQFFSGGHFQLAQRGQLLLADSKKIKSFRGSVSSGAKGSFCSGLSRDEKDILVLYRNTAFVIECKANRYREPLRDPTKAYKRIKGDFEKCIQKGYDQAYAVMERFRNSEKLVLKNDKGGNVAVINTNRYRSRFSIIVTAERFGQIQCDLGLLLKLSGADNYPWSVYIDDLETFLLTLKRKNSFYGEFTSYLMLREKLNERLYCFDEMELCSYFLMQKTDFIRDCNDTSKIFVSSPTMHQVFDDLYNTGLGFKNERNLRRKIDNNDELIIQLHKALNLKTPKSIKVFKKENRNR